MRRKPCCSGRRQKSGNNAASGVELTGTWCLEQIDRKSWEVQKLGLMTESAQFKEHLGDTDLRLKQALREIDRLQAQLSYKDAELASSSKIVQRTSQRREEIVKEELEEQDSRMCVYVCVCVSECLFFCAVQYCVCVCICVFRD